MLPSIPATEGINAIERLRQSVAGLDYPGYPQLRVTFSAGIAQAKPGESLEHLLERADMALYEAKHQGRNRCLLASPEMQPPQPTLSTREVMS